MLRRIVPEPSPAEDGPEHPQTAENPKARAPSGSGNQCYSQRRRQRAAKARSHKDDAVRPPAFGGRKPLREASRGIGESSGFTGSEQKPEGEQRDVVPRGPRRHREYRPPQDNSGQNPSRPDRVAQPSTGDFKDRVRQGESTEYPPHLHRIQMKFLPNGCRRRRDAYPIEVSHGRKSKGKTQ